MLMTVDTETKGLNTRKFVCGCCIEDTGKESVFTKKMDMWNYIIEKGKAERKRNKRLVVYAHNHPYDFYAYADLKDRMITWEVASNPFIVKYSFDEVKRDRDIEFLDLYNILKMSLEQVGNSIGIKKMEKPEKVKEGKAEADQETIEYMKQDARIVMEAMKRLRKLCNERNVRIKTLVSGGQIAANNALNIMRDKKAYGLLAMKQRRTLKTKYAEMARKSYKGAMNIAFKTGGFKNCFMYDFT